MDRAHLADLAIGLVFAAGGAGIVAQASGLRSMPGTVVGSGLFPTITGSLMVIFGLLLARKAFASRDEPAEPTPDLGKVAGYRRFAFPLAVLAATLAVTLLLPTLGFVVAGTLFAAAVARLGGAGWIGSVIAAVVLSVALYLVFVDGLGVPLPRGLLG